MLGILHALKGDLQFGPRVSGQGIQVCDIRGADARRFPGKEDGGKGVGHRRSLPPELYAKIHGERFGGGPSLRFAADFKRPSYSEDSWRTVWGRSKSAICS